MFQERFDQLLSRLCSDVELFGGIEEATRQGAVLPILAQLGWNTYNIREVIPEYKIEERRVDYCLKISDKKKVFLEVKRTIEDLERHEKQLLEYSFAEGVDIAVLTNGIIWWFYLPLSGGSWQDRKFFTIDISKQRADVAAEHFLNYLSRENVLTGVAINNAKEVQASREKERVIREALPKVWSQIFEPPDERLIDLLADQVESITGHRPKAETIISFVHSRSNLLAKSSVMSRFNNSTPAPDLKTKYIEKESMIKEIRDRSGKSRKQRGIVIRLNGSEHSFSTVRAFYEFILRFLVDEGCINNLKGSLPFLTSNKRYLIATSPIHPSGRPFFAPVEYKGYFMEAHKNYDCAFKAAHEFLVVDGIQIEYVRGIY